MMDGRGVVPENAANSQRVLPPPTKRSKLLSSQVPSPADGPEKPSGFSEVTSCRGKDYQPQKIAVAQILSNPDVPVSKGHGQNNDRCLWKKDIPAPLATKIYYSQRSNRLRSAVAYMYHVSSNQGVLSDMSPDISQKSMQVNTSSQTGEHADEISNKEGAQSAFKPDHILGQISGGSLDKFEGCLQDTDMSSQFPISNLLGPPQMPPAGQLGSKYLAPPYSHGGNSAQSIGGTMQQQPNGSVHVLTQDQPG
ncbi:unnamed protein product [Linum tenue]|uniref:Uncharacterized protein n=1 Tax=Linum tenue TaxID=586396 RepID=A0AAV0P781_9ROSI|nr:unnamed protein product [Linum tenue]